MKEGWTYKKLGEVCNIDYGTRVVRSRDGGSLYPVYGGGGATFRMDSYNRENCMIISRFAMSEQCTRFVEGKFFLNDSGLSLSVKDNNVLQSFIDWQIISLNNTIYELGRGAAQKNLDTKAFALIELGYPQNISEQQRIVAQLDGAFAEIDMIKAESEKQLSDAKALFQKALSQAMTPKDGWEKKKLGDIGTFSRGINFIKSDFVKEGYPCIHYGQIHTVFGNATYKHLTCIPKEKVREDKLASKGDLIIAITSEDVEASCKCTAWMGDYDIAVGAHAAIYKHNLNPVYVSYFFQSSSFQNEKELYTHGFKVVEIKPADIGKIHIYYPSPSDQQRIVEELDELSENVKEIETLNNKLTSECDAMKQALLRQVFE